MTALTVVAVTFLLMTTAILSAAEAAVLGIRASRLRTLQEEGFSGAEALAHLRNQPERVRSAVLSLKTLALVVAAGLTAVATLVQLSWVWTLGSLFVVAVVFLFLGELLPRSIGADRAIRLALTTAPTLVHIERVVGFLLRPLGRRIRLRGYRLDADEDDVEAREVREMSLLGQEEGVVGKEESELVERAFRLDETTAWDVMVPRVDIFTWKDSLTLDQIVEELHSVPFSRVPVYGDSVDDVTGILYVRDALENYVSGRGNVKLSALAREPLFVPGSLTLTRLLRQFQGRRIHMGIVADEFGGTDGLVTLEDILEELVGEIEDERDEIEISLLRVSRTEAIADASIDLRELNHAFNLSLPTVENRSLNGFILEELGRVPDAGETLRTDHLEIEVLDASETQVLRARLRKLNPGAGDSA